MSADRTAFETVVAQTLAAHRIWLRRERTLRSPDAVPALLRRARRFVPYYRTHGPVLSGSRSDLKRFPVISRDIVSHERQAFLSSQPVGTGSPLFARTSGSTGRPLTVRFGPSEWYELNQTSYARLGHAYPALAEAAVPGKLAVAMIHDGVNRQETSTLLLDLNAGVFSRFVLRGDRDQDLGVVHALRSEAVPLLYGKPEYLLKLARLDEQMDGECIRPLLVFTSGENLYGDQRRELEARYRCRVVNGYTSVEGGLIALQCAQGTALHVDSSRTLLEVLSTTGTPRSKGEGEIVLTNLWNWTMPFIRYRTGDFGVLSRGRCRCGHVGQTLDRLDGREVGAFAGRWGSVESASLDTAFTGAGIDRYQLEQLSDDRFNIAWSGPHRPEETVSVQQALTAALQQRLGPVHVEVIRVPSFTKRAFKTRRYFSRVAGRGLDPLAVSESREIRGAHQGGRVVALETAGRRVLLADRTGLVVTNRAGTIEARIRTAGTIACAQFSSADDVVAFGTPNRRLYVHRLNGGGRPSFSGRSVEAPAAVTFSYDGLILVAGGASGGLQTWPLSGTGGARVATGRGPVTALATSSITRLVASAGQGQRAIEVRTLPDLEWLATIPVPDEVTAMAFTVDDNILCAGDRSGRVVLWNVDDQSEVARLQQDCPVTAIGFSQSMQTVVAGLEDGRVQLWDMWRGRSKAVLRAHDAEVHAIAALADGAGFLTAGRDGSIRQWAWPVA